MPVGPRSVGRYDHENLGRYGRVSPYEMEDKATVSQDDLNIKKLDVWSGIGGYFHKMSISKQTSFDYVFRDRNFGVLSSSELQGCLDKGLNTEFETELALLADKKTIPQKDIDRIIANVKYIQSHQDDLRASIDVIKFMEMTPKAQLFQNRKILYDLIGKIKDTSMKERIYRDLESRGVVRSLRQGFQKELKACRVLLSQASTPKDFLEAHSKGRRLLNAFKPGFSLNELVCSVDGQKVRNNFFKYPWKPSFDKLYSQYSTLFEKKSLSIYKMQLKGALDEFESKKCLDDQLVKKILYLLSITSNNKLCIFNEESEISVIDLSPSQWANQQKITRDLLQARGVGKELFSALKSYVVSEFEKKPQSSSPFFLQLLEIYSFQKKQSRLIERDDNGHRIEYVNSEGKITRAGFKDLFEVEKEELSHLNEKPDLGGIDLIYQLSRDFKHLQKLQGIRECITESIQSIKHEVDVKKQPDLFVSLDQWLDEFNKELDKDVSIEVQAKGYEIFTPLLEHVNSEISILETTVSRISEGTAEVLDNHLFRESLESSQLALVSRHEEFQDSLAILNKALSEADYSQDLQSIEDKIGEQDLSEIATHKEVIKKLESVMDGKSSRDFFIAFSQEIQSMKDAQQLFSDSFIEETQVLNKFLLGLKGILTHDSLDFNAIDDLFKDVRSSPACSSIEKIYPGFTSSLEKMQNYLQSLEVKNKALRNLYTSSRDISPVPPTPSSSSSSPVQTPPASVQQRLSAMFVEGGRMLSSVVGSAEKTISKAIGKDLNRVFKQTDIDNWESQAQEDYGQATSKMNSIQKKKQYIDALLTCLEHYKKLHADYQQKQLKSQLEGNLESIKEKLETLKSKKTSLEFSYKTMSYLKD